MFCQPAVVLQETRCTILTCKLLQEQWYFTEHNITKWVSEIGTGEKDYFRPFYEESKL